MPCLFHPFFQSVCYPFAIPSFCYPFLVFDFVCYLADYILVFLPFEKKSDLGFHSLLRYPLWYLSVFNINCKPFVDLFPFCPAGLSGCCTISRCTLLYYILLCTVVLYLSVHCCTISYCTLLYYILLYTAVLYPTVHCCTISYCTLLYYFTLYMVQHFTVLRCDVQLWQVLHILNTLQIHTRIIQCTKLYYTQCCTVELYSTVYLGCIWIKLHYN